MSGNIFTQDFSNVEGHPLVGISRTSHQSHPGENHFQLPHGGSRVHRRGHQPDQLYQGKDPP